MKIIVPVATLQQTSSTMKNYTEDNSDLFDQIQNLVNSVENCGDWQGKSMKTLQSVTQSNQKRFQETMQELCGMADFLQEYVAKMTEKDEEIASQIRAVQ